MVKQYHLLTFIIIILTCGVFFTFICYNFIRDFGTFSGYRQGSVANLNWETLIYSLHDSRSLDPILDYVYWQTIFALRWEISWRLAVNIPFQKQDHITWSHWSTEYFSPILIQRQQHTARRMNINTPAVHSYCN